MYAYNYTHQATPARRQAKKVNSPSRLQRATASPPLWDGHPGDFGLTKEPKGETGKEKKRARCLAALSSASGRFTGLCDDRRTKTTSIRGNLSHRETSSEEVKLHAKRAPGVALARRRTSLHPYFLPVYPVRGIGTGCLDAGPARFFNVRTMPRRCKHHPRQGAARKMKRPFFLSADVTRSEIPTQKENARAGKAVTPQRAGRKLSYE